MLFRLRRYALGIAIIIFAIAAAHGQDYPNRVIRIVTSGAGGSSDFSARMIAQGIGGPLGQPVIVDNRVPVTGIEIVSKAPPDGYTLLEAGSAVWLTGFMRDNVPWDPVQDFSPVTQVERSPALLVVHPSLPAKSIKDLIALAKAKPAQLNYAGTIGGQSHLASELFKAMAGVNIVRIAYKGTAAAAIGLMGGEAQLAFSGAGGAVPHIKSGKMRALAVTTTQHSMLFPDLPTIAAAGVPGYESASIDVVLVPAKTPTATINRLHREIVQVLNRPDVKAKFLLAGIEVFSSSPAELDAMIRSEMVKWGKVIKDIGLRNE